MFLYFISQSFRPLNILLHSTTTIHRNVTKLKKLLMECLVEKNILEGRGGGGRAATQFLR